MLRAIALRLAGVLPVLFLVTLVLFVLLRLAPGDAADLLVPEDASDAEVARIRERWGLDQPVLEQYWRFLANVVHLDFGRSYRYGAGCLPAHPRAGCRRPSNLRLSRSRSPRAIAIPLGILAALRKGTIVDGAVSVVAITGVSTPTFWLGILLVLLLSADLNLLPSAGRLPYGIVVPHVTGLYLIDAMLRRPLRPPAA